MKKRAVVGVGVAGFPEKAAGNSWAFLQWGLGLRDLGWEVWLVESLPEITILTSFQDVDGLLSEPLAQPFSKDC